MNTDFFRVSDMDELVYSYDYTNSMPFFIGLRKYELTDHLGNVITTASDRPEAVIDELGNYISGYTADIKSAQNYYPGGMLMPWRDFNSNSY